PVERVGGLDPQLPARRRVWPVLDDHRDVVELQLEQRRQRLARPLHQRLEPSALHATPRTRSTFMTSRMARMAAMISCSWRRSATSITKWFSPRLSSVTVTSALVMLPFREEIAPVISASNPGRSFEM